METKRVRLRFAPSPTGGLHMGGVRTALFNYLFAKQQGGDFILRIEDTDQTRYVPGAEEYIINALKWCGIEPNEGVGFGDGLYAPYRQSERKEQGIYAKYAQKLIESDHAYYAFDTSEELDEMRKRLEAAKVTAPQYNSITRSSMRNSIALSEDEVKKLLESGASYVIRLKVPRNEEIRFHDIIRGWVTVNSSQVDDKVLLKSDGMPTYHLAHIVDDIEMKISHVVRGEEWLPSAPAHVLVYRYLGLESEMPLLAHLPLILKPDGNGKLSKRDKSGLPMFPLNWHDVRTGESYVGYKESGFFPDAFINMLSLLGWNPGSTQEIFSIEELIKLFSFERVNKAGAKFDPEKTKWFNQQFVRLKSNEELLKLLRESEASNEHISKSSDDFLLSFIALLKEKVQFITDFYKQGEYFFTEPKTWDAVVLQKRLNPETKKFIADYGAALKESTDFTPIGVQNTFNQVAEKNNLQPNQLLQLARVAVSGVGGGPQFFDMVSLIGKENVVRRIDTFLLSN